jgi:hypothetical protein
MSEHLGHQEIEMPNGVYVIEKRFGIWMVWSPDDDQPFYTDHSYGMVLTMLKAHSMKETVGVSID